ncbi:hypothetical protein Tcan_10553 [Toxocara canis]|uniref:Uncharacterized protein n=1 Tax=Toxocara canis TaxID=6265 RepID=A0A0B2V4A2_TOXCA|nr:hypothetical protein Tcan_10553 [Toxocara canis]
MTHNVVRININTFNDEFFELSPTNGRIHLAGSSKLTVSRCKLKMFKRCLSNRIINAWNSDADFTAKAKSLQVFKEKSLRYNHSPSRFRIPNRRINIVCPFVFPCPPLLLFFHDFTFTYMVTGCFALLCTFKNKFSQFAKFSAMFQFWCPKTIDRESVPPSRHLYYWNSDY